MTDSKNKQIIKDVVLPFDYFLIERVYPLKITKAFIAAFTDKQGNFNWMRLKKHRQVNHENGIPLNHGFPIMEEEINEIIKRNSQGKSLTELQQYFQRPYKTVANIVENFSTKKNKQEINKSNLPNDERKILNSIINGYNPKTNIPFARNSIWKKSIIVNDLSRWSGIKLENKDQKSSKTAEPTEKNIPYQKVEPKSFKSEVDINKASSNLDVRCMSCDKVIPLARLEAMPQTKFCVNCAPDKKNRKINETWGSRSDWKRDRSSWKRTN